MLAYISKVKEERTGIYLIIAVSGVLVLAFLTRILGLGAESAWIDEAYSINLAQHSLGQILQGTAADQHPPLYYLLLHFWMLFSNSITHARLLSAVLGIILVFQVMVFGWKIGGVKLGIGSALLLTISPLGVWYSQEARQYMLLACLTTASTYGLWCCMQGRKRWVLYWLYSSLAIYTQYFSIFIFLAHAIIMSIWVYRRHESQYIRPFAVSMFFVGIVFFPWIPTAINQFIFHTMPWIGEPALNQIRDVALTLFLGSGVQVLPPVVSWMIVIGFLGLAVFVIFRVIRGSNEIRKQYLFIALWAVIPFLAISILAIFYPIFQLKQFLIVLVPFLILAMLAALSLPRPWGSLFFAGLVLAGGMTLTYQQNVLSKDDWRGVASYIDTNNSTGDIIYGNPAASKLTLELYLNSTMPFTGYPVNYDILNGGWVGMPLTTEIAKEQLSLIASNFKRVWFIEFFPEFWDPNQIIPKWMTEHGDLIDDIRFGKIRLQLFELNP